MLDQQCYIVMFSSTSVVQDISGINEAMLRDKESLSTVLRKFLAWVSKTTKEVSEQTKRRHHPGTTEASADWQRLSTCTIIVLSPQYSTGGTQWRQVWLSTAVSWDGKNTRTWSIYSHPMQYPLRWHTNLHETGRHDDKFWEKYYVCKLFCLGTE